MTSGVDGSSERAQQLRDLGLAGIAITQLLHRLQVTYRGPYHWQEVEQVFRTLLEMSRTLRAPTR